MAITVDLNTLLDKKFESGKLADILDSPVSALSGVSDGDAEKLKDAFGIKTVRDLGRNKHFRAAAALLDLHNAS